MNKLSSKLIKNQFAETCFPLNSEAIIFYQRDLKQQFNIILPEQFVQYLHYYNGISLEGAHIFGLNNQKDFFVDIMDANKITQSNTKDLKEIILGYNMFSDLIYNYQNKNFEIIDKDDQKINKSFENLEDAIIYFLRL